MQTALLKLDADAPLEGELLERYLAAPRPKYPHIRVESDIRGFVLIGRSAVAMRRAGVTEDVIQDFIDAAVAGDLNDLVRTATEWVALT